jgi:hypothetical protein
MAPYTNHVGCFAMSPLYTCKLIEDAQHHPIHYEIIAPDGSRLAEVVKFEDVENLLRHLNMKVRMTIIA